MNSSIQNFQIKLNVDVEEFFFEQKAQNIQEKQWFVSISLLSQKKFDIK